MPLPERYFSDGSQYGLVDLITEDCLGAVDYMCQAFRNCKGYEQDAIVDAFEILLQLENWQNPIRIHNFLARVIPIMLELKLVDLELLTQVGITISEYRRSKFHVSYSWRAGHILTAVFDMPAGFQLPAPTEV